MYRSIALLLLMGLTGTAAGSEGGFTGPDSAQAVTAAEAANLPDDTQIRVEGRIVRSLGDEEYEFQDDSGTLVVEIDDDDWQGVDVGPDAQVELTGELDSDDDVELDVERVRLVQQ